MSATCIEVAPGDVATIVTSLEMHAPPPAATQPVRSALQLQRWAAPVDRDRYVAVFRAIGEPWLWQGRLVVDDAALARILDADTTEVYAACRRDGTGVGLLELDFAKAGEVEIAYFGLVPGMTGNGHGAWLMAHALRIGWAGGDTQRPINRAWVHTCDLDHPAALGFYQRQGFKPFARTVEIYPDPRAIGLYPPDAAPHVPFLAVAPAST